MWMPMCQWLKEYDAWYQSKDMKIKKKKEYQHWVSLAIMTMAT
jgi:hypothetical protein